MYVTFEPMISADNTTPDAWKRQRVYEEGDVSAVGHENAQQKVRRLVPSEPTRYVAEYHACFGRLFDALCFDQMLSDERNFVLLNNRDLLCSRSFGAFDRR